MAEAEQGTALGGEAVSRDPTEGQQTPEEKVAADLKAGEKVVAEAEAAAETKEGGPKEGEPKEGKEPELTGAPEAYTDFTVPDGITVDPEALTKFHGLASEHDLTQKQAQAVVDYKVELYWQQAEQVVEAATKQRADWLMEAKADKTIGGPKFDESVELGKRALATHGSKELIEFINISGIGNRADMIQFMAKVGADISEAQISTGEASAAKKSLAERLFPNNPTA